MSKKRVIVVTVLICMVAAMISGCGNQQTSQNNSDQKDEISISVYDRGKVPSAEGTYTDNRWTKWINEQSGVKVNWVPLPRNEFKTKMNALIASASAPDLIVEYERGYIASLVNNGVLMPIDELVATQSKTYKDYLEKNQDLKPYTQFEDKKMYAVTTKRSSDAIANFAMWIRQDWLDKLGLQMPTTDEELFEVAKAFTERDPDGNGKKDTYGIASVQWEDLLPSFYFASALWYNEGGTAKFGSTLDRYKDYLAYHKKLYDAGVVDKEFFTDKTRQSQKQLWTSGKAGIMTDQWLPEMNRDLLKNIPDAKPVPLAPISTKYGKNGLLQEMFPGYYVAFNKDTKNPKAAMKFVDWMLEKGWPTILYGEENVHYRNVNGIYQSIDEEKNKNELKYANDYAIVSQKVMKPEWFPVMFPKDMLSQEIAREYSLSLQTAMENKFRRDFPYDPIDPDVTKLISDFVPKRDEIRIRTIISGDKISVDSGMKQIQDEWKRLNGETIEKKVTEFYKANNLLK